MKQFFTLILLTSSLMASQQTINVGYNANDNTGDSLRNAFIKVNANETELYSQIINSVNCLYVSQAGNDSSGIRNKPGSPFLTIAGAIAVAQPGDLISIGAGTWNENILVRSNINFYLDAGAIVQGVVVDQDILQFSSTTWNNVAAWTYIFGPGKIGNGGIRYDKSANVSVDVASCGNAISIGGGMSSFAIKLAQPMMYPISAFYTGTNIGDIFCDIPDMRAGLFLSGMCHCYWKGNISGGTYYSLQDNGTGVQRGPVSTAGVVLFNHASIVGFGDVHAVSDAISCRTNSYAEWHGNLRSDVDSGLFMQCNSTATIFGNVENATSSGSWQLAGSGCGIFCGVQTNFVTVYGNVRGLMPIINECGQVTVYGNVSYWNPYNVPPKYHLYTVESLYTTLNWIPENILGRFGSAINTTGNGTNLIYGSVTPCPGSNAVWNASGATVEIIGPMNGGYTNEAGGVVLNPINNVVWQRDISPVMASYKVGVNTATMTPSITSDYPFGTYGEIGSTYLFYEQIPQGFGFTNLVINCIIQAPDMNSGNKAAFTVKTFTFPQKSASVVSSSSFYTDALTTNYVYLSFTNTFSDDFSPRSMAVTIDNNGANLTNRVFLLGLTVKGVK